MEADKDEKTVIHSVWLLLRDSIFFIGLGGNGANAKYDNFKVTGPEVEALTVEVKDKLTTTWAGIKAK
jgi:hypothetical protein